ncbi:MAG: alpha/beta hydrolase [Chitinophagaceae bacterium]
MKSFFFLLLVFFQGSLFAQSTVVYPAPVKYLQLTIEQQPVRMAYMDISPLQPNGNTVLLLHGKNFNGYYWKDVISFLVDAGYRVIAPDQVGFGFSDKPATSYSFQILAYNTKKLIDTLGIKSINIIAHSMGGMLASRFILMYPAIVNSVIYENPIGLEDYKTFVPYKTFDQEYKEELKADFNTLKKYQQSYFPVWKPEYDQYVQAQWEALNRPDFKQGTWASAATYEMIFEQPVLYEFDSIRTTALLIIGQADRTVVGKALLTKEVAAQHGQYPQLGRWFNSKLVHSTLVELEGVGHIPHIQDLPAFRQNVLSFLEGNNAQK